MRYKFITWLRLAAACMIVYDHIGPLRNSNWWFAIKITELVNEPLSIIQHFGAMGVCLFFIISGFLLSPNVDSGGVFAAKKYIRILLTLAASILLFWAFNNIVAVFMGNTYWSQFSKREWLETATLLCFLEGKDSVINGAIWYLFPLLFVYTVFGFAYRLMKKNTVFFAVIMDLIFGIILIVARVTGYSDVRMQWLIFALIPVFGVLIRNIYEKRISIYLFGGLMCINYLLFLKSIVIFRGYYYTEEPYMVSLMYALLLFGIFLLLEKQLCLPKYAEFLAGISYSVYLTHMTFGSLLMSALESRFPFTIAFVVVCAVLVGLGWANNRFIEARVDKITKRIVG